MINYIKYKSILLKGICFLGLLSMVVNGGDMDLEEIRKVTNGKGIFSVAVTNNGKKGGENVEVFVHLTNPPLGCEYLKLFAYYQGRFHAYISTYIEANITKTVELPLPFLSLQEGDDIEQYDSIDNLLPLSDNSEVIVEVRSVSDEREFGFTAVQKYFNARDLLKSRGFNQTFKAKYLAGTKLIELPDLIQISINYDDSRRDPYSLEEMFERIKNALLVFGEKK